MGKEFLNKIRRLNWVLSESTTGSLSYQDLSLILSEIINANVYVLDAQGRVLGVAYTDALDTSTFEDELGFEKVSEEDNAGFLEINETMANLVGDSLIPVLGENYSMKDKYHAIIPIICGGERLGTLFEYRMDREYDIDDIILTEYGTTVVGLEMMRSVNEESAEEERKLQIVKSAISTLSFSELEAIQYIFAELDGKEGILVASRIADRVGITRSVIVNALRKFESAGVIESRSSGMKGTYIKVVNDVVFDELRKLKK